MLTFFLIVTCFLLWLPVSALSWYVVRWRVGRASAPVDMQEFTAVACGCFVFGLLPLLHLAVWPYATLQDIWFVLFAGTLFGAGLGQQWWLYFRK